MSEHGRYEKALAAALAILSKLAKTPDMPRHQKLATATFIILEAIGTADQHAAAKPAGFCPLCLETFRDVDAERPGFTLARRACGCGVAVPGESERN